MFCDLVGSTELSARYEPEDLRTIVRAYQDACAGVVARLEGYIARYMGDGVLVYFGFPRAHEDDAERAVRAGLEIVEAVGRLRPQIGRAHVCTPVTNAQLVCRLLLAQKNQTQEPPPPYPQI